MELIFNELSIQPLTPDKTKAYSRVYQFLQTYKKINEIGFKGIRFLQHFHELNLCENYTVSDFCSEKRNRIQQSLLLGLRRYPFIEDDIDEEVKYLESNFYIMKNETLIQCHGLAAAYLFRTTGIGFLSEGFWNNVRFRLIIKNDSDSEDCVFLHFLRRTC